MLAGAAAAFLLVGLFCAWHALRSLKIAMRIRKRTAIASLQAGPAAVYGTIRALGPTPKALDGTPTIALRTRVVAKFDQPDKEDTSTAEFETSASVDAELTDGSEAFGPSARCLVDTAEVMVMGEERHLTCEVELFRRDNPRLWLELEIPDHATVLSIEATEMFIAEGSACLVVGRAKPSQVPSGPAVTLSGEGKRPVMVLVDPAAARRVAVQSCYKFVVLTVFCGAGFAVLTSLPWIIE